MSCKINNYAHIILPDHSPCVKSIFPAASDLSFRCEPGIDSPVARLLEYTGNVLTLINFFQNGFDISEEQVDFVTIENMQIFANIRCQADSVIICFDEVCQIRQG